MPSGPRFSAGGLWLRRESLSSYPTLPTTYRSYLFLQSRSFGSTERPTRFQVLQEYILSASKMTEPAAFFTTVPHCTVQSYRGSGLGSMLQKLPRDSGSQPTFRCLRMDFAEYSRIPTTTWSSFLSRTESMRLASTIPRLVNSNSRQCLPRALKRNPVNDTSG